MASISIIDEATLHIMAHITMSKRCRDCRGFFDQAIMGIGFALYCECDGYLPISAHEVRTSIYENRAPVPGGRVKP